MENVITVFEQIYQSTYDKAAFYVLSKCGTVPEGFVMQLAKPGDVTVIMAVDTELYWEFATDVICEISN